MFYLFLIVSVSFALNTFHKPYLSHHLWRKVKKNNAKIIFRKSGIMYTRTNITEFNNLYKHDKLILLTPGGLNGFYMLGTVKYLEEKFNMKKYIYSGASAGAWNALLLSHTGNSSYLIDGLIKNSNIFKDNNTLQCTQNSIKNHLLDEYTNDQFNFSKLFIGVTQYYNFKFHTNIYTDFNSLEDAIDCCIASSHIPFITNGLIKKYSNKLSFDGGFSQNPYIEKEPIFIIKPDIWNENITNALNPYKVNISDLFHKGYYDTSEHMSELFDYFNE